MFSNKNKSTESNFWISYADLMAGLLFVFILLIGAIVSKSAILKNELHIKEDSLVKSQALVDAQESFILKKNKLLLQKNADISKEKKLSDMQSKALEEKNAQIAKSKLRLAENEKLLKLKLSQIKNLNKMLSASKTKEDTLNEKIVLVQSLLDANKNTLKKTEDELKNEKNNLDKYKGKVVVLSNELSQAKNSVNLKEEELLMLLSAMDTKKTKYDTLVSKLQDQKAKIKSLTGIKLQVIAALKDAFGNKINIDKKTGSLKLASNILFEVGQSTLKNAAKVELKTAFEVYIGTLVTDPKIKPHLDKIIIEGHTDSDGGYIYNLKLSQDRALAVMQYLLTLNFIKQHNVKPLMIASGRAYLDAVEKNGKEDKEASRRIEIKFRLKNEDAMNEIEKVLDAN